MPNVVLTSVHDNLVDYVVAHGLNPNVVIPLIDQAAAEAIAGWGITGVLPAADGDLFSSVPVTRQFSAQVAGTGEYSQAVTWSITGNISPQTIISADGLLTVDLGEFEDENEDPIIDHSIEVVATSVENGAIRASLFFNCATEVYSITYEANGGDGTTVDASSPYASGAEVTVKTNNFNPPANTVFEKWSYYADGSGVVVPATFQITDNTVLYAIWKPTWTVAYNANGGTGTMTDDDSPYEEDAEVVVAANAFDPPTDATFIKWNTAADGNGTDYEPTAILTIDADTTLYAIWRYAVVEEPVATATYLYVERFSSEDTTFLTSLGEDEFITLNFAEWELGVGEVSEGASFSLQLPYPVLGGMYVINEPLTTGDGFDVSLPEKFTNTTFPIRNTSSLILPHTMNVGFFNVTPN